MPPYIYRCFRTTLSCTTSFFIVCLCVGLFAGLGYPRNSLAAQALFKHTPPSSHLVGQAFTIRGEIVENDDLEEVYLHYRTQGAKSYITTTMTLYQGFRYKMTVPAGRVRLPGLEYYVSGIDLKRKRYSLFGTALKPGRIRIVKKQKPSVASKSKKATTSNDTSLDSGEDTPQRGEERIISASRKEQRIQKAPGIITVITAEDIKAEGWRDVVSLLRYATGMDINQNGVSSVDIGIRGVNPRLSFGDKVVLLVDGHNMSMRQLNRNSTFISIDMIKRIEIIRGPGSALWGANALSGVINIITKTTRDLKGVSSTLGGSPLSRSYFLTLQGGKEIVGGLTFRGSFSLHQNNRSPLFAPIKEFLETSGVAYVPPGDQEFNQYFYGQLSWRGFSLTLYQTYFEAYAPLSSFSELGGDDTRFTSNRYITKLSWIGTVGNWGLLVLWGSYDYFGFGRGSQYEANGLVKQPSASELNGASGYFQLYDKSSGGSTPKFKGIYPVCQLVPKGSKTPCVRLDVPTAPANCILVQGPDDLDRSRKYPLPIQCRPTYQNGRFTRRIDGYDHRVEGGAQLSAQITKSFYLIGGLDFEYLNLLQLHFPDVWKSLGFRDPTFTNLHFSAFLQLQYNINNFIEFTASGRIDYDQQYGFVPTPRAAVVITPGLGLYGKLLYGNAFKSPSFFDLYYHRKNESYGNPSLRPESVHTFEVQFGWYRKRMMAVSINGYFSMFENLITFVQRPAGTPLAGYDAPDKRKYLPDDQRPSPTASYTQKLNSTSLTTYGGEMELRLFPVRGLHIFANFGVYLGQTNDGKELTFAANWTGSIRASYRYRWFRIAAGALFVGRKRVPGRSFSMPGGYLPKADTTPAKEIPVPSWTAANDPVTETPFYVDTFASIQFLNILNHLDIVLRVNNILNTHIYDANDILLTPRKKFEAMAWIRLHY